MKDERAETESAERERQDGREKKAFEEERGDSRSPKKEGPGRERQTTRQALRESPRRRSRGQSKRTRATSEGRVIDGVERIPAGKERAPPEHRREDQEEKRGLEKNPDDDDPKDDPRLEHQSRIPDSAAFARRIVEPLLENEVAFPVNSVVFHAQPRRQPDLPGPFAGSLSRKLRDQAGRGAARAPISRRAARS